MIEKFGQPVLELGSGTGNFLVTLSEKHYEVSGLDNSEEMLGAAKRRAEKTQTESNMINADMRNFDLGQRFKLIFVAGNSLQHLNTIDDVESCFASVKRHFEPNAKFIVEVFNPSLELLSRDPNERFFVGEYKTNDGWVVVTENVFYDAATQINNIKWHYRNQYMKEERTVNFTMRQFFPQELDYLFAKNGFKIDAKFGDFEESNFTRKSPNQIIIASL